MVTVIDVAQACHEANRRYCQQLGGDSQLPWDEAPEWQHKSCLNGVHFLLSHPEAGHRACHESWHNHKVKDGWVWGPVKDTEKKEHPCMVPFDKLPLEQQLKDLIFWTIVRAMQPFLVDRPVPTLSPHSLEALVIAVAGLRTWEGQSLQLFSKDVLQGWVARQIPKTLLEEQKNG